MANLVASDGTAELSHASDASVDRADLIVNARVATAPEELEQAVRQATELPQTSTSRTSRVEERIG